jgi:hypothetical protein
MVALTMTAKRLPQRLRCYYCLQEMIPQAVYASWGRIVRVDWVHLENSSAECPVGGDEILVRARMLGDVAPFL